MSRTIFTSSPTLPAGRITLRALTLADDQAIFLIRSNENVRKYIDRPVATTIQDARASISSILNGVEKENWFYWAVTLKEEGNLIGTICLFNFSKNRDKAEAGFELLPAFQGKGYMQEALTAVVQFGFETLKLDAIEAFANIENASSIRLLERNHFTWTATLAEPLQCKDGDVEMKIYTLSEHDWVLKTT